MKSVDLLILVICVVTVLRAYRKTLNRNFRDWASLGFALWFTLRNFGKFTSVVLKLPGMTPLLSAINKNIMVKIATVDSEISYSLAELKAMNLSKEFNYFFEKSSIFKDKEVVPFTELSMGLVINVASLILLFVFVVIVIRLIFSLFENINKMAGFTMIEKSAGMIFGFLKSLVYAMIISMIVYNIAGFFNSGILYDAYYKSTIAKAIYESGLIAFLFGV